jgi:hypothetical protein
MLITFIIFEVLNLIVIIRKKELLLVAKWSKTTNHLIYKNIKPLL